MYGNQYETATMDTVITEHQTTPKPVIECYALLTDTPKSLAGCYSCLTDCRHHERVSATVP